MAASQDIALYLNDLQIRNGDLLIGESDSQHVMDSINAFPGWWKENPVDGVGLFQYSGSVGKEQEIAKAIKVNLTSDGYTVNSPQVSITASGQVTINPNATRE